MHEAAAVTALAVTLSLALRRPVLPRGVRVGPGIAAGAGVLILTLVGPLRPGDVAGAVQVLWGPLLALASIMVMTGAAARVGLFQRLAELILPHAAAGAVRLFAVVFLLSLATAAVFNNDAAILVLTPVVVPLVRRIYPDTPSLLLPFAFAVFMAAGVAPLFTSNPMNTVVAVAAGIDFNAYAARMVPVALAAAAVTFLVLRWVFATELAAAPPAAPATCRPPRLPWSRAQWQALALVLVVLAAYPAAALAGLPIHGVAATGAVISLGLCWRHRVGRPFETARTAVAWEVIVFLFGMYLLAKGLQHVGVVDQLRHLYQHGGTPAIAGISAVGSALINNHSMALTNLLAIQGLPGNQPDAYLAALIGGDLGPRLLPVGSLAGLLWLTLLARMGVMVPLSRFIVIGAATAFPSLITSLAVLTLL
jgi:arsenical pump membrane protein